MFARSFSITPEQAWNEAYEQLRDQSQQPWQPPDEPVQQYIARLCAVLNTSDDRSQDEQRIAIRSLGLLGYPWPVPTLLAHYEREADPLVRTTIIRSLGFIAGRCLGDDVSAWREWLGTLDPAIVGPVPPADTASRF